VHAENAPRRGSRSLTVFEEVEGRIDDLELEVERKRALKYDGIASGVNHDAEERQKMLGLLP
jgi:hypothetical protein